MTQMVQIIVDGKGLSGLDLKTDPGVLIVYAGFGSLMFTTCISFLFYLIHRWINYLSQLHPSLIGNYRSIFANSGSGCKTSTSLKALKHHSSSRGIILKLQRSMTKRCSLGIAPFSIVHSESVTSAILRTSS
uniref:Uncharacterized protein n=1 Tax=Quercus lobata TaxID=97700 RepID=A0A7N2MZJ2_QUELO